MSHSTQTQDRRLQIQRLQELPPLPVTAQEILRAVNDEDIGLDQIAAIIKRDPGLAARIIGLANSAFFGTRGITTVEQAIIRSLGLATVKSLSLSMVMGGVFDTRSCRPFDLERYWRVSLLSAHMAELLAHKLPVMLRPDPKQAYLCGLLHNLGLLAMATCFPLEMGQVFSQSEPTDDCVLEALEQQHTGIEHHQAGAWLGHRWHLPEALVASIEARANNAPTPEVEALVRLSRFVNYWACHWVNGKQDPPVPGENGRRIGLDAAMLMEIQQRVSTKYDGLSELAACMSS